MAAFFSVLFAALFKEYLEAHQPMITAATSQVGTTVAVILNTTTGLDLPEPIGGFLVLAIGIAFCWGIFYHLARHGR